MGEKEAKDTIEELNRLLDKAKEIIDAQEILITKQRGCLNLCLELLEIEIVEEEEDMYTNLNNIVKGGGGKSLD